eukprot:251710_1
MSTPTRTTFEVTVSNKLEHNSIFVQIQAELRYATKLSSSFYNNDFEKNYNKKSQSDSKENSTADSFANSMEESKYDKQQRASSKYDNNKIHNQSTYTSNNSNNSSNSSLSANAEVNVLTQSGSASFNHNKSNKSSSSSLSKSNNNLKHNISSKQNSSLDVNATSYNKSNSASNAVSKSKATSNLNTTSNEYNKNNSSTSLSELENNKIIPGFVRVAAHQSLSIPVIVENESQIVYITVYINDYKSNQCVPIANALQINSQHVEILRNIKNNDIIIQPVKQIGGFRDLLLSWHLPQSLCDSMKNCGWDDPELWNEITENDLIRMGFKRGHRTKFNKYYERWKTFQNWVDNKIEYKDLLNKWKIPNMIADNMKNSGWDDIHLWHQINDDDFEKMKFDRGHKIKFKSYIKDNQHIQQFKEMEQELKNNVNNTDDENENKNIISMWNENYNKPDIPLFKIDAKKIYHDSFQVELNKIKKSEFYIIEIKEDDGNGKHWKRLAEIKQTKNHQINNLKMNTNYLIRIKAQNKLQKESDYSKIIKIKTKKKKKKIPFCKNSCNDCNFLN